MTKMNLTDRINAIHFDSVTEDEFNFLVERALKSVRPAGKRSDKPNKRQVENMELADKMVAFVKDHGPVKCADLEVEFNLSNQKVSAILNRSGKFVKVAEAKGKDKAVWDVKEG